MQIIPDQKPAAQELLRLFQQCSWAKDRSLADVEKMLEHSSCQVALYDDQQQLIGFGRAITDHVFRAHIDDIVVDATYRGQGLGKTILNALLDEIGQVDEIFLNAGPELEAFYQQFGFARFDGITMKR